MGKIIANSGKEEEIVGREKMHNDPYTEFSSPAPEVSVLGI